jgi:hypothetical protein
VPNVKQVVNDLEVKIRRRALRNKSREVDLAKGMFVEAGIVDRLNHRGPTQRAVPHVTSVLRKWEQCSDDSRGNSDLNHQHS